MLLLLYSLMVLFDFTSWHVLTIAISMSSLSKPGVEATSKRSEILQAGVTFMSQECATMKSKLADADGVEDDDETVKVTLNKHLELLTQSIVNDQKALVIAERAEGKRASTPKRRKLGESSSPDLLDFALEVPEVKVSQNTFNENDNIMALKIDGAQVFSEVIQSMSNSVDTYTRIGKVPRQVRDGTSQSNSKPFSFIKVEVSQPAAKHRMHLIAWGNLAMQLQQQLLGFEDKVVRIRNGKYDYAKKFEEHQIKLSERTTFEEVRDPQILQAFDTNSVPEASIGKIGEYRNLSRINLKGYVRSCDDSPNGPSSNASYWRNFDLSDSSGSLVKGMAWGSPATIDWTPNVTVEMFNVSVRKSDERIQVDDSSIIIFKDRYDLSSPMPTFFKPVIWQE